MIGSMEITAELQPRLGDRDDYIVTIIGPEPSTPPMKVPFSLTGSVIAIWKVNSKEAVEQLARTIFGGGKAVLGTRGTASGFPEQGYWFDSYNSEDTLKETLNKILNQSDFPFIKNRSVNATYGLLIGQETGGFLDQIDKLFNEKFGIDFFKELDEVFALSEIADTLTEPPKDNANFLYKISLLSSIIDAIHVRTPDEKGFSCSECTRVIIGSIEALQNWLAIKVEKEKAEKLVKPFKMIKKIRNQFPIHNHFELKNGIRIASKAVTDANEYFGFTKEKDYETKWNTVLANFNTGLLDIIAELK